MGANLTSGSDFDIQDVGVYFSSSRGRKPWDDFNILYSRSMGFTGEDLVDPITVIRADTVVVCMRYPTLVRAENRVGES